MKIVRVGKKQIKGISVRTTNANEMDPETSKIGGLWQTFYEKISVALENGATVYGVYYNYESDASGEFSILAGSDHIREPSKIALEQVSVENGNYMIFEARGDMPQIVIDT